MTSNSLYQYLRVTPAPEIRLLEPLPGHRPVECMLAPALLSSELQYEALSYCWGSSRSHYRVICNGQGILVTENLQAALFRLRLPNGRRTLWIDAISINQEDVAERNSQVSLMREIYQTASHAIVWLGEEDKQTASGFALAKRLAEGSKRRQEQGDDSRLELPMSFKNIFYGDLPNAYHPSWSAFSRIFERPWFHRVWVRLLFHDFIIHDNSLAF